MDIIYKVEKLLKFISDIFYKIAIVISGIYFSIIIIIVSYNVVLRFLGSSAAWVNELSRWLMIAMTFIAASAALKRKSHIGVVIMVKSIPNYSFKKIIIFIANLLVLLFLYYLTRYSFIVAMGSFDAYGGIVPIPAFYPRINIALGSFFMLFHMITLTYSLILHKDPDEYFVCGLRD